MPALALGRPVRCSTAEQAAQPATAKSTARELSLGTRCSIVCQPPTTIACVMTSQTGSVKTSMVRRQHVPRVHERGTGSPIAGTNFPPRCRS